MFQYAGTLTSPLGANPAGTPFSGLFSYGVPQVGVVTPYSGGTQSAFAFDSLTLTINGRTVVEGPGQLGLYNNIVATSSVPGGDSLYTFTPGVPNAAPNPSTGSFDGLQPNFIYLGFVDASGRVFSGPGLPSSLELSSFSEAFVGVNFGPAGAGNTTEIFPIASLTGGVVPEPSSVALLALGLSAVAFALGIGRRTA